MVGLIFLLFSVVDILSAGYQYSPVLTEKDLLTVQSPEYCANIFKTSLEDISVFINSSREVTYVFRTVTDVNVFLFEVTANKEQRTLGKLKENSKNLVLEPQHGYFLLQARTDNLLALDQAGDKYQFKISANNSKFLQLKFENKLEMFKFLISNEGKELKVLAFDQRQILDKSRDAISVRPVEEVGSDTRVVVERKDDQNNRVDVQREDPVVKSEGFSFSSMLEKEIKDLGNELEAKDEIIERQRIQNKKMEQKYYELRDKMKKIGFIVQEEQRPGEGWKSKDVSGQETSWARWARQVEELGGVRQWIEEGRGGREEEENSQQLV